MPSEGILSFDVFDRNIGKPIEGALVQLFPHSDDVVEGNLIEELTTDAEGQSALINVEAPDVELSLTPEQEVRPYSEYDIYVTAPGMEPVSIHGIQVLPDVTTIQQINMYPPMRGMRQEEELILIKPHTLWGTYEPKIPEDPVKPLPEPTGYVVLDEPVIPEYIIVHDGTFTNNAAPNYWIPFKDYIKNVASSEIYATWPANTIRANVLAILSFTLNRVYTEWYRSKGKDYTITSSTAYDHAFFYGRNIYKEISQIVEEIFNNYVTRPGIKQPLLTQYCDGNKVSCPGWMTQWGSKYLGDQGYKTMDILRYYYGEDIYLDTAVKVVGVPSSYPGYPLRVGSRGDDVRKIQQQLNAISRNYPGIPKVAADGIFGPKTAEAVKVFQKAFYLTVDGIVGKATWYKISEVYVAVTKMAG